MIRIKQANNINIEILLQPDDIAIRPVEDLQRNAAKWESALLKADFCDPTQNPKSVTHLNNRWIRQHSPQFTLPHLFSQSQQIHNPILFPRTNLHQT